MSYMGYDQVGNQVLALDELGNPTYFTHDGLNRSTHVEDALGGVTYMGYDSRSSAVLRVDADGRATYMAYDPARRLERQWFANPVAGESADSPIYYTYDQVGNLKIVDDRLQGLNVTYFDHDSMDRVGKKATITGWIYYEFDLSGKRTKLVDPDGETNYYVYDAAGRLDKLQVAAGRSAYFAYDLSGMVTRRHAPLDEVVAYYTYNAAGRLKQLENRNVVGGLLSYFAYERNQVGAQTRIRHEGNEDTYYEYDALDRLTREFRLPTGTGREHDDAYVYDAVGNRTVKADQTAGENVYYTFDARNLMSKEWNKDAPETTYFDYDNARRMTSLKIEGGQSSYFAHDQRDQVKKIEFAKASSPDQTQEFGYNGAGERVKLKVGDGSLTDLRLAFDGRKLLAEKNLAAIGFPTIRRYRHNTSLLDCMGSAIEWDFNGSRLYGAFNGLGTLTNLLRDFGGGEIVENTYLRDAFGRLVTSSTPLGSDGGKLQFISPTMLDLQLTNVQINPLGLGGCYLPRPATSLVGGNATQGLSDRERAAILIFLFWLRRNGLVRLCQDPGRGDIAPETSPTTTRVRIPVGSPWVPGRDDRDDPRDEYPPVNYGEEIDLKRCGADEDTVTSIMPDPARGGNALNAAPVGTRDIRFIGVIKDGVPAVRFSWVQFVKGHARFWVTTPNETVDIRTPLNGVSPWTLDGGNMSSDNMTDVKRQGQSVILQDSAGLQAAPAAGSHYEHMLHFASYLVCPVTPKEDQVAYGFCLWQVELHANDPGQGFSLTSPPVFCQKIWPPIKIHDWPGFRDAPRTLRYFKPVTKEIDKRTKR